ncbi:PREDICTED: lactosylceramide 4-alpha-galactosyltransferase-like [Camelina sativa]|uniref:Lactosylceramide 4-alpha-galactosyltransferase-like n=1 Tax=Camelina sativa TaxID=90675 RepID=A0ABM0TBZ3_CAMSA|nr:PREDICTED: lactosylceramide 4-alpha-galactosyltransferase-like [Camelina sativa]
MDHDIEKRFTVMIDHRRLNQSASSPLFTVFSITFIALILVTTLVRMSNFSMQLRSDDYSEVKIEIKRVIPHLPLSSEKDGERKNPIKQQYAQQMMQSPNLKTKEKLQVIEIFSGDNLSEKFQKRVIEFVGDGCEVNFVMTWISSAEFFGKREVLAIESVFKSHPRGCLMILSATLDSPQGYTILKPFLDRGYKVIAVTPDLSFLLKGTAGESWLEEIKTGKRDPGKISLAQNLSNLMRLAYLYKYGGVYLDTDMIVLKSFKGLRNVIGAQTLDPSSTNWTRLNNAVLIFDKNHPLLLKFIEEFAKTFNGNIWGYNGPYLVSRVARAVEGSSGYNFTVMRPSAFYSVNWLEIKKLFRVAKTEKDSRWVKVKLLHMQRSGYGLHLWNKFSKKYEIEQGSAMWKLVSEHCIFCEIGSAL